VTSQTLQWLSFLDDARPVGRKFLGVAIVEAADATSAVAEAWRRGISPGSKIAAVSMPLRLVPESFRNRLLLRAEAKALAADVDRRLRQ
jgi:hypothetical protein